MKRSALPNLIGDESAAVLVEYALVLSLLSFAFVGGMGLIEAATNNAMTTIESGFCAYEVKSAC